MFSLSGFFASKLGTCCPKREYPVSLAAASSDLTHSACLCYTDLPSRQAVPGLFASGSLWPGDSGLVEDRFLGECFWQAIL